LIILSLGDIVLNLEPTDAGKFTVNSLFVPSLIDESHSVRHSNFTLLDQ